MESSPPLRFIVKNFLQADVATFIGGLPGHGKTLLLLSIVKALLSAGANKKPTYLFDYFEVLEPAKRVIYLTPESALGPFYARLKMFGLDQYMREGRLLVRTLTPVRDPSTNSSAP